MITIRQIKKLINSVRIILIVLLFGGCHSSTTSIKDLLDLHFGSVYICVRCVQIGQNDTVEVCYSFEGMKYCLSEDSLTRALSDKIEKYVLDGEVLLLPEGHFLLQKAIHPIPTVDSVYCLGYKQLLREYFFCVNELKKETSCYLDWLHSACGNSVYFGHRSTPCYYKDGDNIMEDNMQYYIISLLYKNNIYCMLDENGNVCLLNCNLKKEDITHIPFPTIEIR
jgi:hypothetical protein